jgi:hypothetical protein
MTDVATTIAEFKMAGFGVEASEDGTLCRLCIDGMGGEAIRVLFPSSNLVEMADILMKLSADLIARRAKHS